MWVLDVLCIDDDHTEYFGFFGDICIHTHKNKEKKSWVRCITFGTREGGGLVENVRREEREKKAPFCSAFKSKACLLAQNS